MDVIHHSALWTKSFQIDVSSVGNSKLKLCLIKRDHTEICHSQNIAWYKESNEDVKREELYFTLLLSLNIFLCSCLKVLKGTLLINSWMKQQGSLEYFFYRRSNFCERLLEREREGKIAISSSASCSREDVGITLVYLIFSFMRWYPLVLKQMQIYFNVEFKKKSLI